MDGNWPPTERVFLAKWNYSFVLQFWRDARIGSLILSRQSMVVGGDDDDWQNGSPPYENVRYIGAHVIASTIIAVSVQGRWYHVLWYHLGNYHSGKKLWGNLRRVLEDVFAIGDLDSLVFLRPDDSKSHALQSKWEGDERMWNLSETFVFPHPVWKRLGIFSPCTARWSPIYKYVKKEGFLDMCVTPVCAKLHGNFFSTAWRRSN